MLNASALKSSIVLGTILQLAMVSAGHFVPAIAQQGFAIGGMTISAVAGYFYARNGLGSWRQALLGGGVAGGVCALIGIAVSTALGDVPPFVLLVGTTGSTVTGCVGAIIRRLTASSTV